MKRLTIPETVRVGAVDYNVNFADAIIIDGDANYAGACSLGDGTIQILSSLSEQGKLITFMHELTHAIFEQAGYDEHDENMIDRISKILLQVLRDNEFCVEV